MKTFLTFVAVGMLSASAVLAQETTSNSQSASGVVATIQGAAGAVSNNTFTNPADTTTELRNVPAVSAPGVVTAFNCAQAVSAGASIVGGGISFGGTYTDENCERIAQAAALNVLAGADVALYHLAVGDPEICKSLRATGRISASSDCGDGPSAGVLPSASSKSPTATRAAYTKCELTGNKLTFQTRYGQDRNLALAQCKASVGIN